mgnify:CR=1 FL=1
MIKTIMVSEDRMAVLIGRNGSTKREIEKKTNTRIRIGEDVKIDGNAIDVLTAGNIIIAISRGFSPENAFLLMKEENAIEVIDLPKNKMVLKRVRSRLIGTGGKCRRNIELLTKTKISIYGRTVAIIGKYENVGLAKDGIERLLKGLAHRAVYEYLEGKQDLINHAEQTVSEE